MPNYDEDGPAPVYQSFEEIQAQARANMTLKDHLREAFQGLVTLGAIIILGYIGIVAGLGFLAFVGSIAHEVLVMIIP